MGSFYVNYTLRGSTQAAVAAELAGRTAIVSPEKNGCVVVFDEESDDQNGEIIAEIATRLSGNLRCSVLSVLNHDDDVLQYWLHSNGELVDDYDSTPAYFEQAGDEDADDAKISTSDPRGGNADLLCQLFDANTVKKVEIILRKPSLGGDAGYVFAIERHQDLVDALGIPSFAVGGSYKLVADGDDPEELNKEALLKTKNLVPAQPAVGPVICDALTPKPGYYKVSFRAVPGLARSIPISWMPAFWADLECSEEELSEDFRRAIASYRERFTALGFSVQGFKKLKRVLNPDVRDGGGINYLDGSRRHFGQLIYNKSYVPSLKDEKVRVIIAFSAVFETELMGCTNNPQSFETLPTHKITRMQSQSVADIHGAFLKELEKRIDQPKRFDDLHSLKAWFDSNNLEIFQHNVRRGTWVRMSDYEVALLQGKSNPNRDKLDPA
jgi:hypothetical protein